ncbi:MAG: efflux RND transporter periplasmic adaptor subunit [Anaerolineales bacterium]
MKRLSKAIVPIILVLAVLAALWYFWVRPAGSVASAWASLVNPNAVASTALTASGTVETTEISIAPQQPGEIMTVNVDEGDVVKAGDVLVQLDDTLLKDQRAIAAINLETAKQALAQLTSPMVLANAQEAAAQDRSDLDNAQKVLNDQLYFTSNTGAIQNAQAALVLANNRLSTANTNYDKVSGYAANSTVKAFMYQQLYAAQQAYNNALYVYNVWSGENNQEQIDIKTGNVAVIQAKLAQDQAVVNALTTGQIPPNATGPIIAQIQQAQLNINMAQANLNLLDDEIQKMTISSLVNGIVMTRNAEPGSVVNAGAVLFTLGRLDDLTITVYVPEDRIGEVKLGQSANVTVDSFPGVIFKATVSYISDEAEFTPRNVETVSGRKNTVFAVKLNLMDTSGRLKPGMPADVIFDPE